MVDDKYVEMQSYELKKIPHESIFEVMTSDEHFRVVTIDKLRHPKKTLT